ncbi:peptidoglycan DD-metalloendopeptidase family protein [Legionella waltersii]|uniref:M23/M37 family transporter peptidase n=1 Tax=Legionella waltersii TaxID=66969 RepID=A0A0W1A2V0_9GAMM|nr:peptidoglycan DD-metalloendopeptidase family protein [Legionella waltersii]KTD75708.1 M23/M37 family transporter peptidase [Legionella waltersii]SNU99598.1 peptidase, M23/M37 family [Legionella waltersii]
MDKRPKNIKRKTGKPSKIVFIIALIVAFSLPYYLESHFSKYNQITEHQETESSDPSDEEEYSSSDEEEFADESAEEDTREINREQLASSKDTNTLKETNPIVKEAPKLVKDNEWQTITPRSGDSMAAIFKRLGLSAQNLHAVVNKNPHAKVLSRIKPSQKLQFLINKNRLEKLVIPVDFVKTLTIYRVGNKYKTRMDSKKTTTQNLYLTATVKGSLYSTSQRLNIPSKLIRQMVLIFNKEIDFSHSLRSGDQFSIIYDAFYVENKRVGIGDIVAVSYTNKGKTYQAIRHKNARGEVDYYTPKGNSFKKAFNRYPIKFSHISSTFTISRYHPILHYRRAHKGIDLAARIGTPIRATGDGVITIIDRHNGYGNMIKIQHDKTYSTVYGHMLKFQKGLYKGSRVKRGQVIGYVGQTGLATGPHCHYELHVHNQPKNPTTIPLPTASPVPARELAGFKAKAGKLIAQLKLYESAQLASKGKKKPRIG